MAEGVPDDSQRIGWPPLAQLFDAPHPSVLSYSRKRLDCLEANLFLCQLLKRAVVTSQAQKAEVDSVSQLYLIYVVDKNWHRPITVELRRFKRMPSCSSSALQGRMGSGGRMGRMQAIMCMRCCCLRMSWSPYCKPGPPRLT